MHNHLFGESRLCNKNMETKNNANEDRRVPENDVNSATKKGLAELGENLKENKVLQFSKNNESWFRTWWTDQFRQLNVEIPERYSLNIRTEDRSYGLPTHGLVVIAELVENGAVIQTAELEPAPELAQGALVGDVTAREVMKMDTHDLVVFTESGLTSQLDNGPVYDWVLDIEAIVNPPKPDEES